MTAVIDRSRTPAVIYAAKSTEDKAGSIPAQLADCRAMAEREGLEVVGEFRDEGFSAFHGNRGPGLEAAKRAAVKAVEERGSCFLVAQHSDRVARGAGDAPDAADHLDDVIGWLIRRGATLRTVQDDFYADPRTARVMAAMMGQRNTEDSRRKGEAVAAGLQRAAERGDWGGRNLPDGYRTIEWLEHGAKRRRVEKDPERSWIYDLIWDLAQRGVGTLAIVAELDRRRVKTAPRKRDCRPRPFDANRIRQILRNRFYAGQVVHRGEVVAAGHWPGYISPEDFERLQTQRRAQAGVEHRKPGRPRGPGHLLAGIARCGECGAPMDASTSRWVRKDGTRSRRYICRAHRDRPADCAAQPIDAARVDPSVIENIDAILGDVGGIRDSVAAAHGVQRSRLKDEVTAAQEDIGKAELACTNIAERIATLSAAGEKTRAEALDEFALPAARKNLQAAKTRRDATLDALHAAPGDEADPDEQGAVWIRLHEALRGRIDGASDDIRSLNAHLRDFLESIELTTTAEGVRVVPIMSEHAVVQVLRDLDAWQPTDVMFLDRGRLPGSRSMLGVGREQLETVLRMMEEDRKRGSSSEELGLAGPGGWTIEPDDNTPVR